MPQVTIKFEDTDDGKVNIEVKCNPDIDEKTQPSGAQKMAMAAMEYVQFIANGGAEQAAQAAEMESATQPAVKPKPGSGLILPR